jgi:hypothetical protein
VARIGKFSSDRTIVEYNQDIWHADPVPIERSPIEPKKSEAAPAKTAAAPKRRARK